MITVTANDFYFVIAFVFITFIFGYWCGYEQAKINIAKNKGE